MSAADQAPTKTPEQTFEDFVNGRLTKGEWTHEAHLITAWVALRDRSPSETLGFLRHAIQTHNCGIGIENSATSGYHETLTRYYVTAVDVAIKAGPGDLDSVLNDAACDRRAPLEHWSRDTLFSTEARLGWVGPDRAPTPWPIVSDDEATRRNA